MRRLFSLQTLVCAVAIVASACGSDSTSPANSAAGNYTAISFVTSGNSGQTNQIALGSTLQLNLATNGTTSGHLHIAASGSDPAFDADMAGTWTQAGSVVTISQSADTFVRDMPFTLSFDPANGWILVGNQTFSGTNIQVTLKRT
jgi:hypothetical protein